MTTNTSCPGCGVAVTPVTNGTTTIHLDASGKRHACAPAPVHTAPAPVIPAAPPVVTRTAWHQGDIPARDPNYLIDRLHKAEIARVIDRCNTAPQNLALVGPAGTGKTSLALQIGAARQSPTFVIDSSDKASSDEWFGKDTLVDGNIVYQPGRLVRAVQVPNATIVLDDLGLLQSASVQNGLNGLLDPTRRGLEVEALGAEIKVADGVLFVGTWNRGFGFSSVAEISEQILDRFRAGAFIEVPYPDEATTARILQARTGVDPVNAARLSQFAGWLRSDRKPIPATTRGLIAAAHDVVRGATLGEAVRFTVLGEQDDTTITRAYQIASVRSEGIYDLVTAWTTPTLGTYETF